MSCKYRNYDQSTNIILSTKLALCRQYGGFKLRNSNNSSKKVESLNIKIFDRNKRYQRILSRNERMDLFLQGGNFSQSRRMEEQRYNDNCFYKLVRMKKKSQIFASLRHQAKPWNNTGNFTENEKIILNQNNINYLHSSDGQRNNIQFHDQVRVIIRNQFSQKKCESSILKQRSNQKKFMKNKEANIRDSQIVLNHMSTMKGDDVKGSFKANDKTIASKNNNVGNSDHQLQKIQKGNRPLFYLDQREISQIKADSFIVKEYPSGQIICGSYFRKSGQIASLTKIMTFYTVYDIADRYNKCISTEIIEIDEQAQSMTGTSAQIFVGDAYTVQQLLYGLMLPSGNDAATALAKWGGTILQSIDPIYKPENKNSSIKTFVKHMNAVSRKCGMKTSKFCNPHGLPHPQSFSNAQDLACLMSECLRIQLFREVIKTKKYNFWTEHQGVKHQVIWENTNKLLRRPYFIGGKTGVTVTAGPCLASCYELGEKILIVVLLRTTKLSRRFKDTRLIVGLALAKLDRLTNKERIKQVLQNDAQLDSDNSDDEQSFNYEKTDAKQMSKRVKILTFEM